VVISTSTTKPSHSLGTGSIRPDPSFSYLEDGYSQVRVTALATGGIALR